MSGTHPYWLIVVALGCALIPLGIGMMTSYLKVSIVVGMIKNAIGVQHAPGTVAEMALSLAITLFVMSPVIEKIGVNVPTETFTKLAATPTLESLELLKPAWKPWQEFLSTHAGEREVTMLQSLHKSDEANPISLSARVLVTAFVLTELKEAFMMAFAVLVPFLVIDLIVANILTGMGMFMVSPALISLPIKLLLFAAADGWVLLTRGLILSYGG